MEMNVPPTRQAFPDFPESQSITPREAAKVLGFDTDLSSAYDDRLDRESHYGILDRYKSSSRKLAAPVEDTTAAILPKQRWQWVIQDVNLKGQLPSLRTKNPLPGRTLQSRATLFRAIDGKLSMLKQEGRRKVRM